MSGQNKENFYLVKVSEVSYAIFNFDAFPTFEFLRLSLSNAVSKPFKCNIFCSGTKTIMENMLKSILKEYPKANIIPLGFKDITFNSVIQSTIKESNLNKPKEDVKKIEKKKKS